MTASHASDGSLRRVIQIVSSMPATDGAGVKLNRLIGTPTLGDLDPFLMLDEFRSDDPNAYIAGFPNHPHRGFETVTYMLAGRMRHGDNQGNTGLLTAGSVQWMTAGRGIVHSEMPEQEDGMMWGFQLWINLPAAQKMTEPGYQDITPEKVPTVRCENGASVKVLAGAFSDTDGPATSGATDPLYLDISLPAGADLVVPIASGHTAFVYVFGGTLEIDSGTIVDQGQLAVLSDGQAVVLRSDNAASRALVLAGRPLNEPIAKYGPFVMNTQAELQQAVADYQSGRF